MSNFNQSSWVIGVSGASGLPYSFALIRYLLSKGYSLDIIFSNGSLAVLEAEYNISLTLDEDNPRTIETLCQTRIDGVRLQLEKSCLKPGRFLLHRPDNLAASVASGSYQTQGMVIVPASNATIGKIAHGIGDNLICRSAEVALKERRPLIVVPRETPLSLIALRNLTLIAEAGGIVLPASPAFYHGAKDLSDMVDFVVGKILNIMNIGNDLFPAWDSNIQRMEKE